jgi:uncharacterized protein (DUF2062 family)
MPEAETDIVASPPRSRRQRMALYLRGKLTEHCSPGEVGRACALGAAIGVAPIPGFQVVTAGILAWRLKLNLAIVLLVSNISLGPLLLVWAAVSASIGRWLRTGTAPWDLYDSFHDDLTSAGAGFMQFLAALGRCFSDWLLGSLLLMPVVAAIFGFIGYGFAVAMRAKRSS